MKLTEPKWLGSYIYYQNKPNEILAKKIQPLIKEIVNKKWAKHFFYIRYYDQYGLHIRLRMKGEQEVIETRIKPYIIDYLPYKVRFVTYRPELKRYGGKSGILIAEEQFEASSNVALAFFAENPDARYERSLGTALQINLNMMHAFGMDRAETAAFFNHLVSLDQIEEFEKNLMSQQNTILPFIVNLWNAFEHKTTFDRPWFTTWQKAMSETGQSLQSAYADDTLRYVDPKKSHSQNPLWYIYESYVHMNNNRLGIINTDEQYMAYIIKKALETIL
ncbi:MAG: thiopeptide-type bacteriocin biosynthesis protein [Candidatus Levyibacteriota bacterium]